MWIRRKVQHGNKTGRKIGFPTINLNVGNIEYSNGVYDCEVKIQNQVYKGALYFGPGFKKHKKVLEIFVINFNKKVYGKLISFKIGKKIRGPKKFDNLNLLKKQITDDLKQV